MLFSVVHVRATIGNPTGRDFHCLTDLSQRVKPMSGLAAPFSREALEKLSDRKKRKLAIDCSDVAIMPDSQVVVVEDSQSGYRDLFGELIPLDKCSIKTPPKSKSAKKRPTSRKKKPLPEEPVAAVSPASARPPRVFIPTPKIMRIMKDAQAELYSLMGLNKSTSDASVVSNDSLNVSGVQDLLDSSITSVPDESKDNGPPLLVLEGKLSSIFQQQSKTHLSTQVVHKQIFFIFKIMPAFV